MDTLRDEILACAEDPVRNREDGKEYELTYHFGADFTAFSGHFPSHPILPAFVQLLAGECALQLRMQRSMVLRRVKRAKFLKPIQPDQMTTVRWQEWPLDNGLQGSFTLLADGEKAATFTMEMAAGKGTDA
jgi:3-hydroxyacyl-[acyl-carrier-protein] dehydratase